MGNSASSDGTKRFQCKTISALGSATWLVTSALAGCSSEEGGSTNAAENEAAAALTQPLIDREGGDRAAVAGIDLATDDVGYLTHPRADPRTSRGGLCALSA